MSDALSHRARVYQLCYYTHTSLCLSNVTSGVSSECMDMTRRRLHSGTWETLLNCTIAKSGIFSITLQWCEAKLVTLCMVRLSLYSIMLGTRQISDHPEMSYNVLPAATGNWNQAWQRNNIDLELDVKTRWTNSTEGASTNRHVRYHVILAWTLQSTVIQHSVQTHIYVHITWLHLVSAWA